MTSHKFIGDREAPALLASVHNRRPILGTGKMPKALQDMMLNRSFYYSAQGKDKPDIHVEAVDDEDSKLWKINVPVIAGLNGERLGRTLEKHPASKFHGELKGEAEFSSHRPDWMDASPQPKMKLKEASHTLRRLDGRIVEPLWVYDSARHAFQDASWPWGLVGRVFNSRGQSGTGTLVGNRVVITAGHMVPWGDNGWWMRFVPAYFNGSSLHGAGVESFVSDARGYDVKGNVTGYDWAVLRLYEPLGTSLGYFGYNSYSDSWNDKPFWSNIGYPGDIDNAQEPSFQKGYTFNDTDGDSNGGKELETENCDLFFGNSGGPSFAWWNNGTDPRIVGVVSGQETEYKPLFSSRKDNVFASGDGFVNLCAWGRANWPA